VEAQVCNNVKGKDLKQEYRKKVKEENIKSLKLFFGGKEIMDDALIAEYGIQDDFVVQVMVKKE